MPKIFAIIAIKYNQNIPLFHFRKMNISFIFQIIIWYKMIDCYCCYTFTICLKNCVRYSKSNMKSPGKLLCFQPVTPFERLIFRREIQNLSTLLQLFLYFYNWACYAENAERYKTRLNIFSVFFVTHFSIFLS